MKLGPFIKTLLLAGGLALLFLFALSSQACADPFAYVTNATSHNVSVIDTETNTVIATVPVGTDPLGVAITPDGARAYVTNYSSHNVSVIDTETNTVAATVGAGNHPMGVAITPDGARAYVTDTSSSVLVIDTATNTVIANVTVGGFLVDVAITPDGARAYVADFWPGSVLVIDTATNTVIATVPVGTNPYGLAITPDGARVYVPDFYAGKVLVIDTATNTVSATVPVGSHPRSVAITPDGARAYVTNSYSYNVSVIDTATNTVSATVPVGSSPRSVAITPDGTRAYVPGFYAGNVSVIDTATNNVSATVPVGTNPMGVAIAVVVRDGDGDGIEDAVDGYMDASGSYVDQSDLYSDRFTDQHRGGKSYGEIITRGGLVLKVTDAENAEKGLLVEASGESGRKARIRACRRTIRLTAGDYVVVCGSLELAVLIGVAEIELGDNTVVVVPAGATATVSEPVPSEYAIENTSTDSEAPPIVVQFHDRVVEIPTGQTHQYYSSVSIDIKPGSDPNSINLCSKGVVPIAIYGSETFHVLEIVMETVRLDGAGEVSTRGRLKEWASYSDLNGDGFQDVIVHMEFENLDLAEGVSEVTLTGELSGYGSFEGTDTVNIVRVDCPNQ
jgi:YVTN family beta-propeller protein